MKFLNWLKLSLSFSNLPLVLILCIGTFLRFTNFPNRISMGPDSARDAMVSLEGARTLQFPISGPFTSIAPVTTGPWYWYQLILARILFPTNYAPWLLLGIYSVFTIVIMYFIGLLLDGRRFGLILAVLTTFARNQILVATELVNPSVIGFYTSVVLLIFILLMKHGPRQRLGLLLGLVYGISLNTHYQTAGLMSLLVTLVVLGKRYVATFIRSLIGILITSVPLLLFEFTNHWYNVRHFLRYILVDQYTIWTPMRWLTFIIDYWPRFIASVLGGEKLFGMILMAAIAYLMILMMLRRRLPRIYLLLLLNFSLQVVIIRYYRGERYFGYLQFFHPFLIIFTGYVLHYLYRLRWGKLIGSAALVLYLVSVIPSLLPLLGSTTFTEEVHRLSTGVYEAFGLGPFKLYQCQGASKWEITGLSLQLAMDRRYSSSGKPLIYRWGCNFPDIRHDGTRIYEGNLNDPERIFPKMDNLYDVSIASPAAMAAFGWVEVSPATMYQSAARWWMDEQP